MTSLTVHLPDPTRPDGTPTWITPDGTCSAHRDGVRIDGRICYDVTGVEASALALLAAVHAHRGILAGTSVPSQRSPVGDTARQAAELIGDTR